MQAQQNNAKPVQPLRALFVEAPGEFRVSSAEHVLAHLPD